MMLFRLVRRATASGAGRWAPLAALLAGLATIAGCLYQASTDLDTTGWPVSPPISAFAESDDGFPLFAWGFTALCLFLGAALLCRAAWLDAELTSTAQRRANSGWLATAAASLPFVMLMAWNRDDGPRSDLHFTGAGIGMGLICVSGIAHAMLCGCYCAVDRGLPSAVRGTAYCAQGLGLIVAIGAFGSWFVSDKTDDTMEWAGFITAMVSYLTYAVYFVRPPPLAAAACSPDERSPLVQPDTVDA